MDNQLAITRQEIFGSNLDETQKRILLLKTVRETVIDPIINPLTDILKGFASSPVTGLPLLSASSEYLYKYSPSFLRLRREIATLLFSPSAVADTLLIAAKGININIDDFIAELGFNKDLSDKEYLAWSKITTDIKTLESERKMWIRKLTDTRFAIKGAEERLETTIFPEAIRRQLKGLKTILIAQNTKYHLVSNRLNILHQENAKETEKEIFRRGV